MTKFVRSEWDIKDTHASQCKPVTHSHNSNFSGLGSDVLMDLFQSFEDRISDLHNVIYTTIKDNVEDMKKKINIAQTGVDSLVEMLHETCFEAVEERLDNRMDALEKRLNDTRNQMKMKPDYQDISHRIREHLYNTPITARPEFYDLPESLKGYPNCALSIEQKKHICSAIDKWGERVKYFTFDGVAVCYSTIKEELKCMICDSKVGEFIDE